MTEMRSWFHENQLTGTLPTEWSAMAEMDCWTHTNQLTGTLPAEWSAMTRCRFWFPTNQLTGRPRRVVGDDRAAGADFHKPPDRDAPYRGSAMTEMQDLYLNTNQLTETLPTEWR